MISLIIAGIAFVVIGGFIMGTKTIGKLDVLERKLHVSKKILGNLGEIMFLIGILCIVAGVVNLVYS